MECNKEEAFKAKELAEKKMENKDFLGARKIAIKAQNLYPGLENISQLIMVCDVYCSAENKILGTEMDWYGILKLEPTADDVQIKKQFRRFALNLHPDKNKFAEAADAFKLIGEAQRVLLDKDKRKMHDMKRKSAKVNGAPKQASKPSSVQRRPRDENSSMNANRHFQQAPQTVQTGSNNNNPTFWTTCPFCETKYQFYRDALHRNLLCRNCQKAFTAYEFGAQGVAPQNKMSQSEFPKQTGAHNQAPFKAGPQSNAEFSSTKVEVGGNTWSSEVVQGSKPVEKLGDVLMNLNQKRKAEIPQTQTCGKMNEKKLKQFFECSKSFNSKASTKSEEEVPIESGGLSSDPLLQRSSRTRTNVSCTGEAVEDLLTKQEPPDMNRSTGIDAHMEENEEDAITKKHLFPEEVFSNKGTETEKKSEHGEPSEDAKTEPETFDYPDPDFSDFDINRDEKKFAAGQIWAVYDTRDAMPRFYAQIGKVFHPKFKLRITWLEADPDDKDEIKWAEEDLPVSCGNFRQGSSENTEDRLMFSHVVSWEKGNSRNTYKIYPKKGETWALFKRWNINWSSDPENHRKYEYEFVEVLSDYADGTAISVAYLGKVKGYVCLFCRTKQGGVDIFQVEPKEIFRFSHRIPSFQVTGENLIDELKGSFELDPVCLPPNLQEIDPPTSEDMKRRKMPSDGSCSTFATDTMETIPNIHVHVSNSGAEQKKCSDSCVDSSTAEEDQKLHTEATFNMFENPTEDAGVVPDLSDDDYEIPDPEFCNFDAHKSIDKFEIGQVWAIYCDEDGMPKYYGWIKKIDILPKYRLTVAWLEISSTSSGMIQWIDKNIPVTCGRFKLKKMKPSEYTSTAPFSHQVRARVESTGKKKEYVILPRKGEIWALYKSWNAEMKCSDLENCDYDIVEVIEESQLGIYVLSLEVVDGFKSVFRTQVKEQFPVTFTIPANELLRFSHQIPSFRLTEERGGSLRGYLELDPAAFPFHWFCKD
ncbi:DnaJ subfamily B member like [Heracleum sosnowskyi]|uniref:DnaJ subfamily B member like n=1 Tax=Heracleum sosnowskyi TaxID=360622 RepID=A0AAD8MPE9_9APIA|nr:DnaJ subfamily B member like [Heracleum sosnowskyi]